ncbi:Alg9-like mannosyltransferase family-domain-containing protein [Clohesyomyces aquaticus]|uniref:Mannosyltransferase n=1 Tax=Clohesyomyces aquaticus TaxID=1231657 RepID=A0A1Y2AAT2_9PLEO|nr:Alg9-like mannosyltransferase family-domain-containing protein [Clohesyomyces aquaticus]
MARFEVLFYLLIPTFILIHLFASPYTKVEESFNIQAIHDILIHGIPDRNADQFFTANYDHMEFPGSVPRTFAGALILSGLSRPFVGLFSSPASLQLLVRAVLGLLNAASLVWFGTRVRKAFGQGAAIWYALLQASQFHVIYYASRTLPNIFALVLSTIALGSLLDAYATPWSSTTVPQSYRLCLYLLTFCGVVFRSELAILVGTLTLYLFATQRIPITTVIIPAGLGGLVIGLLCTVSLDSFFWQSVPLWPEWTGFYFNTIQGHSADWGVSPWHYYFLNALPRLLMNPMSYLVCIPLAILNPATRRSSLHLLVPLLGYVGLYSFLPHKEWRFIIYVVPGLTAIAAAGASWVWTRRGKSVLYAVLSLALLASVFLSFMASTTLLAISSLNYPGGAALQFLHTRVQHPYGHHFQVYFDNLACQTGVTRFLENHYGPQTILDVLEAQALADQKTWTYSKTEDPNVLLDPLFWAKFDYVLAERPEKIIGKWGVIHTVYGFDGLRVLKPGEPSDSSTTDESVTGDDQTLKELSVKIARSWKALETAFRERLLKGWWVEVKMEPKIRILANYDKWNYESKGQ